MARSILPSRARSSDWSRAEVSRRVRRERNRSLHELLRDAGTWDDGIDFGEQSARGIAGVVSGRRAADKLNHFHRWAFARTRHLERDERLDVIRPTLPASVIGDHALSHLQRDERFAEVRLTPWRIASEFLNRGELAQLLRTLLFVPDGIRWFHRALKTAIRIDGSGERTCTSDRVAGVHDVTRFLAAIQRDHVTRCVVDDFFRAFKRTRDAEASALQAAAPVRVPNRSDRRIKMLTSR